VSLGDHLRVAQELRLQDGAGRVGDAVSTDALLKDAQLLEVARVGQPTTDRRGDALSDQSTQLSAASGTARALSGVSEAEFPWLLERKQPQCLPIRQGLRIAVALRDQQERQVEVRDQQIVGVGPEAIGLLEHQKRIDEQLGVHVEDRVEPVVLARPLDPELRACQHASSIGRVPDAVEAPVADHAPLRSSARRR
jgi:hypothetical protein